MRRKMTLNDARDLLAEMFPGQSVSIGATSCRTYYSSGEYEDHTDFAIHIHHDPDGIEYCKIGLSSIEASLAGARAYKESKETRDATVTVEAEAALDN